MVREMESNLRLTPTKLPENFKIEMLEKWFSFISCWVFIASLYLRQKLQLQRNTHKKCCIRSCFGWENFLLQNFSFSSLFLFAVLLSRRNSKNLYSLFIFNITFKRRDVNLIFPSCFLLLFQYPSDFLTKGNINLNSATSFAYSSLLLLLPPFLFLVQS